MIYIILNFLEKHFNMIQIKNLHSLFNLIVSLFIQMLVKVAAMDNSFVNSYSDFSLLILIVLILCCHNLCKIKAELIFVSFSDFYSTTKHGRCIKSFPGVFT